MQRINVVKTNLIITAILIGTSQVFAMTDSTFRGDCAMCGDDVTGTCRWGIDAYGNDITIFASDNGEWLIYKKGHVVFIVKDTVSMPMPADDDLADVKIAPDNSSLKVETDKPVIVRVINVLTGTFITEDIIVDDVNFIDIADLQTGCNYGVVVYQIIPDFGRIATSMPLFCKE